MAMTCAGDRSGRRAGASMDYGGPANVAYGYDGIGRPAAITDELAGTTTDLTTAFTYNRASQMASQDRSNPDYGFSGRYNVSRSYTANGLNQYSGAGPSSFTYDANGNLTSASTPRGTTGFTYDGENRLVTSSGARMAGLRYDPLGRLWQVSDSTATTRFQYDGDRMIMDFAATSAAGPTTNLLHAYVHGPGTDEPIAVYDATRHFLFTDRQGSIINATNDSGASEGINTYDEWGIPGANNTGRFQYTGQVWLPEVGLYYYKARMYSPTLGRFMQTDPIGYHDQMNLYAYVENDSLNKLDPTGMQGCADAGRGNQAGLSGACVESANYRQNKDGLQTVVGTPEIDQSAREHMLSIQNDRGPNENTAQFRQDGSNVVFCALPTTTGQGNDTVIGRSRMIGNPQAIGHSQPDLAGHVNIAPGFQDKETGDHVAVNGRRPNYIVNSGMVIVIERSQEQYRARVVLGEPTSSNMRDIRRQLDVLQRGSR